MWNSFSILVICNYNSRLFVRAACHSGHLAENILVLDFWFVSVCFATSHVAQKSWINFVKSWKAYNVITNVFSLRGCTMGNAYVLVETCIVILDFCYREKHRIETCRK